MRVGIIGQGYVGLTISVGALRAGHEVIGVDYSQSLITSLSAGKSHIEGISDGEISAGLKSGKFLPTSSYGEIADCDIVVIAVPTPLGANGSADLTLLEAATTSVGQALKKKALVINESTSYPGTLRDVIRPLIEKGSPLGHMYAISPERVDPGNKNFGTKNTPRVVGGLTDQARDAAVAFYSSFCDAVLPVSSPEVAEAAKLFENTFRFINIGLVNEFAQVMGAMGIPVDEVLAAAGTKPYGFMPFHPNVGIGGHCIPVDPMYLQEKAIEFGVPSKYIAVSQEINHAMPGFIVDRLSNEIGGLKGKKIQVVGVSYKANISDTRESPAVEVVGLLRAAGAVVTWHDPLVPIWSGESSSAIDSGVDAGLVLVAHDGLDVSAWKTVPVYCVNRHPKYAWTPLITVKSKY